MQISRGTIALGARRPGPVRDAVRERDRARRRTARTAALLSALVSMGAYCLAMAVHGTYPFGPRSRAVNDLGNQFVPFHAHLWDLMHGHATGDLLFNWSSGYGVPFLADFFAYLMNPFSWLVAAFPRDAVQTPVFLIDILSIGLGAALMTVFLGLLRAGSPWLRALLSVGYAVSGWTVTNGFSDPMWMWGLVSLPVLGIAYDWCLRRRRWVLGSLLVAACWAGNFYTGAMASIGMALILLLRLALDERPIRERGRVLLRAASMSATGILLAAPVLTVSYKASKASQPPPKISYSGPPHVQDYLAHLLPGGLYPSAPQISVGLLPLLLVGAFPFMRGIPGRERIGWLTLILLVALSYIWTPTILLWHGNAMPNGSPYRASLVMTAILVAVGWLALARRPRPRELLAGGGALVLLLAAVSGSSYISGRFWVLALTDGALVLGLLLLLHRHRRDRRVRIVVTGALAGSVFLATAYNVFAVTSIRDQIPWWQPKQTVNQSSLAAYRTISRTDDWPFSRTDPGPHAYADNDPLLLGGEGGAYYSSYVPEKSAATLQGLGAGWYWGGRHILSFNDPVGRAIMAVSSYLGPAPGTPNRFRQHRVPAPPVVTLRPGTAFDSSLQGSSNQGSSAFDGSAQGSSAGSAPTRAGSAGGTSAGGAPARDASVFDRQERVLGAKVYTVPALSHAAGPRPSQRPDGSWRLPGNAVGSPWTSFSATCTPGDLLYVYAPWFAGTLRANGTTYRLTARYSMTDNGILPAGTVPAGGRVSVAFGTSQAQNIPRLPLGCLSHAALDRAIGKLRSTGPVKVTAGGHSIDAVFRHGTTGTAVVAAPAVNGWRCSAQGAASSAPRSLGGLIAVTLRSGPGGSRVNCSYQTPGLSAGLTASGLALAVLLAVGAADVIRNRSPRFASRRLG